MALEMAWIRAEFKPDDLSTRAEAAQILGKAATWCHKQGVKAKNPLDNSNPTGKVTKLEACRWIVVVLE
jgi:hypothetical protein